VDEIRLQQSFGCPVKVINDAAMQALGSYKGGRMLFLDLHGLGSAMIWMECWNDGAAHLLYKNGKPTKTTLAYRGLERMGKKKWAAHVAKVTNKPKGCFWKPIRGAGRRNCKILRKLPAGARLGSNENAFLGGFRMWEIVKHAGVYAVFRRKSPVLQNSRLREQWMGTWRLLQS